MLHVGTFGKGHLISMKGDRDLRAVLRHFHKRHKEKPKSIKVDLKGCLLLHEKEENRAYCCDLKKKKGHSLTLTRKLILRSFPFQA